MPKVILVLHLIAWHQSSPHSKVYLLTFLFAKIKKSLPFYPRPTSGKKKEQTYY